MVKGQLTRQPSIFQHSLCQLTWWPLWHPVVISHPTHVSLPFALAALAVTTSANKSCCVVPATLMIICEYYVFKFLLSPELLFAPDQPFPVILLYGIRNITIILSYVVPFCQCNYPINANIGTKVRMAHTYTTNTIIHYAKQWYNIKYYVYFNLWPQWVSQSTQMS